MLLYKCKQIVVKRILIFVFVFFTPIAWAEEDGKIAELLEVSGINSGLGVFVDQVKMELNKERITHPDEALSDFEKKLYMEKLQPDVLKQSMQKYLQKHFSQVEVDELIKFYKQDIMVQAARLEEASATPEGQTKQAEYLQKLYKNPPPKERVQLIHSLEKASMATETSIYIISALIRERIKVGLVFNGQYDSDSAQKLDYQIYQLKENMEPTIRNQFRMALLYVYKDFTNEEIEELITLLDDKRRVRFQIVVTDGMAEVLTKGVAAGLNSVLNFRAGSST